MPEGIISLSGQSIGPADLMIGRARAVAEFVTSGLHPYVILIDCIRRDADEIVVMDLSIEVGQAPVNDIRTTERIAAVFGASDNWWPQVLSLREDFPHVPHLNATEAELPRSICLYEERWEDQKLRWTPPLFVERIRIWLRETGRGTLHASDQPLEPILATGNLHIVIPADLYESCQSEKPEKLELFQCEPGPKGQVLRADRTRGARGAQRGIPTIATAFALPPITHGIIRAIPRNLGDVQKIAQEVGVDLVGSLRARLDGWEHEPAILNSLLAIIVFLPKTRISGGPVESMDVWAFLTKTIRDVGVSIGLWGIENGIVGRLLGPAQSHPECIPVDVLNPTLALSRERAAALNGVSPDEKRITAIGLGALGSQLVTKLIRGGYGTWTFIDEDFLLPHNVARHELSFDAVGFPKAPIMMQWANSLLDTDTVKDAIAADVLHPGKHTEKVAKALTQPDLIADFSASVAVGRYLALDLDSPVRRVSAFLNPSGSDLVLLAEDQDRTVRLDSLEMQYYREVFRNPELQDHLRSAKSRLRYAQSCRDLSSTIPEDSVALHAAIGSRAVRHAVSENSATIRIWKADQALAVRRIEIAPAAVRKIQIGEWVLQTDETLISTIMSARKARLPVETGGVLLGSFDLERRIVYVIDAIPSPPDSIERPMAYIRGCQGLLHAVQNAEAVTGGMLQYIGEWHSHPDGFTVDPSSDDRAEFAWLGEHMKTDGLIPLMLIAGDSSLAWLLDKPELITLSAIAQHLA